MLNTYRRTPFLRNFVCCSAFAIGILASPEVQAQTTKANEERPVIGLNLAGPVNTVYQITADTVKDGKGKGLTDLEEIYQGYIRAGVDPGLLDMTAVFHSKASAFLLTDEAWNNHHNTTGGNPNTALISALIRMGLKLELCDLARTANHWGKDEIHPGVTLVGNAYHRIAELQTLGKTYVKF